MKADPKIGVFICHCGKNIAEVISIDNVVDYFTERGIFIKDETFLCADPGLKMIKEEIIENNLDKVVIAACTPNLHESLFRKTLEDTGLNPYLLEIVNIREQDSWVHAHDPERATQKAIDLIAMGIAKATLLQPFSAIKIPVENEFLVIGGGVAGIRAALDLADLGHKVYLVEKEPTIGGHMAMFDKVFPTNDCSICILAPLMVEVSQHPNIEMYTYSEVIEVEGGIGNFRVTIRQNPRYVDEDECTGCGDCIDNCPIEVPSEFDLNLGLRKAIYLPFPQAVPFIYTIDPESCIGCRNCESYCERNAVKFDQMPKTFEVKVGAIIVATGYEPFDARKLGEFGYGKYSNVLTALELERLLSPSGPTEGDIVRPSDGKPPKSVVFIQCVGSRDKNTNPWCSRVCCMYAMKQAYSIKERLGDSIKIYICYIDMRAFGKRYEEFYAKMRETGVTFIHGQPSEILELPDNNVLTLNVYDLALGKHIQLEADLVVLSIGLTPPKDAEKMSSILGIPRSEDGFYLEGHPKLRPVDSQIPGFYIAGCAHSPKDIESCTAQASAAALKAAVLAQGEVALDPFVPFVDPDLCFGCKVCEHACDYGAIQVKNNEIEIDEIACRGCGACAAACSTGALQIRHFTDAQIIAQIAAATRNKSEYPLIIGFLCNWCAYAGADNAGIAKINYPTNIRIIKVMCSARVSPIFVLEALKRGADGVLIMGCHPGDCHYDTGFMKAERRIGALKEMLGLMGLDNRRVKIVSASASEGKRLAKLIREYVNELEQLQPVGAELIAKTR
jgi:heterodisulfide reductase subunit A